VGLIDYQSLKSSSTPSGGLGFPIIEATSLTSLPPSGVIWTTKAHSSTINDVSWSGDGRYVVTSGEDGWARVWDVDSRQCVGRLQPFGRGGVCRGLFVTKPSGSSAGGEAFFLITSGSGSSGGGGSGGNSEVKLWRAWMTLTPVVTQSLILRSEKGAKLSLQLEVS